MPNITGSGPVSLINREPRDSRCPRGYVIVMQVFIVTKPCDLGVDIVGVFVERASADKCCEIGNKNDALSWIGTDGQAYSTYGGWDVECWEVA